VLAADGVVAEPDFALLVRGPNLGVVVCRVLKIPGPSWAPGALRIKSGGSFGLALWSPGPGRSAKLTYVPVLDGRSSSLSTKAPFLVFPSVLVPFTSGFCPTRPPSLNLQIHQAPQKQGR